MTSFSFHSTQGVNFSQNFLRERGPELILLAVWLPMFAAIFFRRLNYGSGPTTESFRRFFSNRGWESLAFMSSQLPVDVVHNFSKTYHMYHHPMLPTDCYPSFSSATSLPPVAPSAAQALRSGLARQHIQDGQAVVVHIYRDLGMHVHADA